MLLQHVTYLATHSHGELGSPFVWSELRSWNIFEGIFNGSSIRLLVSGVLGIGSDDGANSEL